MRQKKSNKSYIDRLTKTGISYKCAKEIVEEYLKYDDIKGLNQYINLIEYGFSIC